MWHYAGIEPPAFAALVPNSADKPLQEVMEEIMGDHEMIVRLLSQWLENPQTLSAVLVY